MKKYKWIIILVNLVILLVVFNRSIVSKEKILKEGKLVFLKLAPVDPRSLIQGDYMELRYEISENLFNNSFIIKNVNNNISDKIIPKRGYCVILLDSNNVGRRIRFQHEKIPKNDNELLIEYTSGQRKISIGAESYFFEEGQSKKFENAKYGGLKIDNEGNSILFGLYDEKFKKIE